MAVPAPSPLEVQEVKPYKTLAQQIQFTNKTPINNTLNKLVALLDMQFATVQATRADLEVALDEIMQVALDRMNEVFTPLIEEAQKRLEEFGANFTAHSPTSVTIGLGPKTFFLDTADRAGYVYADFVSIRHMPDAEEWMIGNVLAYDREVGQLEVDVVQVQGSGTFADWEIRMTVPPDLAHANRTDNPHQTTALQVGAYTKAEADTADSGVLATIRGGIISTYDTLQKLYSWANNSFNQRLRIDATIGYSATTQQIARNNVGIAAGFANYFVQAANAANATALMGVASKRILNINSGFQIAQEYGDNYKDVIAGEACWPIDGWLFHNNCNATWRVQRHTFYSPGGSRKMLALTVLTSQPTINLGQYCMLRTTVEGNDIQQQLWGIGPGGHPLIVRFGLRSPLAGPFSVMVSNSNLSRCYVATFTVDPQYINYDRTYYFVIPPCPDGTWNVDESVGLMLHFFFAVHSGLTTMTPNQWLSGQAFAASGQVQGVGQSGITYVIADVAIYDGIGMLSQDYPQYQLPSISVESDRCKRRYQSLFFNQHFWYAGDGDYSFSARWPVAMRAIPNIGTTNFFFYPGYTDFTTTVESITFRVHNYPTLNTKLALGGTIIADARM